MQNVYFIRINVLIYTIILNGMFYIHNTFEFFFDSFVYEK